MIEVNILKQGRFAVTSKKVKDVVKKTLVDNGIVSDAVVDISFVGKERMDEINKKYYKDEVYVHPIFTFPEGLSNNFVFPPDGRMYLGEIVISYPEVVETAREKNKTIDEVACDLAAHGCLHLVGIHHV